jgi:two-component system sensor histidine kinase PilS (NtrC family)
LTGGVESPFTFAYLLAIVAASILLYQRGASFSAAISAVSFCSVTYFIQVGMLRGPLGSTPLPQGRYGFALVTNLLAQFFIAALAGYLSRQLLAAGGRLSAREADIRELVGLQRQILSCMPSGLITCEADGTVTFANRAAKSILGLEDGYYSGRTIDQLIPGILKIDPGARRTEMQVTNREGMRILGLTVTSLEGAPGALLIVFQDLTELRRAEDELKRVDRLAALGKLSAQLAHEIRNPLASMRGSAQMLAAEIPNGDSARLASVLIRESDRLSSLVEDFLRFARPPTPQMRPYSLKQLLTETLEILCSDPLARGIKIQTSLSEMMADIDPDQMKQVLINILRNAFAAVSQGGEVKVVLDTVEGHPRIRIWDSAGSIPSEVLERIFEPFFTTRKGGTGLGLSTAHSIVRAHGGMIYVTSSRSEGTEFTIGLRPIREAQFAHIGS